MSKTPGNIAARIYVGGEGTDKSASFLNYNTTASSQSTICDLKGNTRILFEFITTFPTKYEDKPKYFYKGHQAGSNTQAKNPTDI